jgi:predicted RNA binding protein YcfA (HicA-like mRNA interferase family)
VPRKLRQLKTDLRRAGASIVRQRGSHTTWQHPDIPGVLVELAGQDGDDAQPYQERDVRAALQRIADAHIKEDA